MSDDPTRRGLLRGTGVAAGAIATNGLVASTSAARKGGRVACDGATEETTRTGSLSGADDADTLTYTTKTSDPCEVVLELASTDATDFDLYVTTDGRTPTTSDYDAASKNSLTSGESLTLDDDVVDANASVGVLVDSYTAGGDWTLDVIETTTESGGNQPPTASFTVSSTSVGVDESVEFDATASDDADGSVSTFEWNFGDGAVASGATATHAYDGPGTYTVTLTVTDDDGATAQTTKDVTVESTGGECGVTKTRTETGTLSGTGDADAYSYPSRTAEPCEVTLSLTADAGTDYDLYVTYDGRTPTTSDYDDRAYNYGSDEELVVDGTNVPADGTLGLLVDSYDGSGDYTFTIEEVGTGDDDTDPEPNDPPSATFAASDSTVGVGESVEFDASASSDPDGTISAYDWAFGDGSSATGSTVTHGFDAAGEYTVSLTVTDDAGATDSSARPITVESSDGDCGAVEETAGTEGSFWWYRDADTYTYDVQTARPCEISLDLDGPSDVDFDLYVTTDGRTPTRSDYDARSAGSGGDESITLDAVDESTSVGILVYPTSGYGSYQLDVVELGR